MDTSEQYILMCDCPEIQEVHDWEDGDFYTDGGIEDVYYSSSLYFPLVDVAFLPRQDQIQKMLGGNVSEQERRFHAAYQADDIGQIDTSGETWEQLWLAFYMHEVHSKKWTEKGWVKE